MPDNDEQKFLRSRKIGDIWEIVGESESHVDLKRVLPPDGASRRVRKERVPVFYDFGSLAELEAIGDTGAGVGILVTPTSRDDFKNLILHESVLESIRSGLLTIEKREELEEVWGLSHIEDHGNRVAMNFHGPPGTGKTASARAIARLLKKNLFQVDYASCISRWVGDTGKHIREAFAEAKAKDAILFFDEADSLLSRRIEQMDDSVARSINQNRNILMQELDRFDGMVIFATNLFTSYDEALLRRIAQHVHFELPNESGRKAILEIHQPPHLKKNKLIKGKINIPKLAEDTKKFSGGDLKNVWVNAIKSAAAEGKLTQAILEKEVEKIRKAKSEHSGESNRRPIGLCQG